jgi:hypothetical protein
MYLVIPVNVVCTTVQNHITSIIYTPRNYTPLTNEFEARLVLNLLHLIIVYVKYKRFSGRPVFFSYHAQNFQSNVMFEGLIFILRIRKVPASNLARKPAIVMCSLLFSSVSQGKFQVSTLN